MSVTRPPTPRSRPSAVGATRRPAAVLATVVLPVLAAACLTVSRQQEIDMGRDYARQIDAELPLIREASIRDPVAEKYRVDEKRQPGEDAEGSGPAETPDRTGACGSR